MHLRLWRLFLFVWFFDFGILFLLLLNRWRYLFHPFLCLNWTYHSHIVFLTVFGAGLIYDDVSTVKWRCFEPRIVFVLIHLPILSYSCLVGLFYSCNHSYRWSEQMVASKQIILVKLQSHMISFLLYLSAKDLSMVPQLISHLGYWANLLVLALNLKSR